MSRGPLRVSRAFGAVCALIAVFVLTSLIVSGQAGATNGEWRHWGADLGNTKYSPLDQINRDNVKNLRVAWRWKADNFGPRPWMYRLDEGARGDMAPRSVSRGVEYWTDGKQARIILITRGYRMVSLDARTGLPDPAFGRQGLRPRL